MIEQHRQYGKSPRNHSNRDRSRDRSHDRGAALTPRSARTTRSTATRARRHFSDDEDVAEDADGDRNNNSDGGEKSDDALGDDMSIC